ncbi:hypothetical protein HDU90_000994 [Geranomyces variabilis]|nr:hypothetical protein HDU90_000994 [Geranomyces variabilis]
MSFDEDNAPTALSPKDYLTAIPGASWDSYLKHLRDIETKIAPLKDLKGCKHRFKRETKSIGIYRNRNVAESQGEGWKAQQAFLETVSGKRELSFEPAPEPAKRSKVAERLGPAVGLAMVEGTEDEHGREALGPQDPGQPDVEAFELQKLVRPSVEASRMRQSEDPNTEAFGLQPVEERDTEAFELSETVPGLLAALMGKPIVLIGTVNCSNLRRMLTKDALLDDQRESADREFSNALRTSIREGGILIERFPDARFLEYVTEEEYEATYQELAGDHKIWEVQGSLRAGGLREACEVFESGLHKRLCLDDLEFPDMEPVFSRTLSTLFTRILTSPQRSDSEASWAASFVLPMLDTLRCGRWKVYLDTSMVGRMRPDLWIASGKTHILSGELKSPYAQSTKRNLQVADGLARAKASLKDHVRKFDWKLVDPMLFTMIAPDGDVFHFYKVVLRGNLYFFVELGSVLIVSSIYNVDRLERSLLGFARIRVRSVL